MSTGLELVKLYLGALARGPGLHTLCNDDLENIDRLADIGCVLDNRMTLWPQPGAGKGAGEGKHPFATETPPELDTAEEVAESPAVISTVGENVVTGEQMPEAIVDEPELNLSDVIETAPPPQPLDPLTRNRGEVQPPRTIAPAVKDVPDAYPGAPRYA